MLNVDFDSNKFYRDGYGNLIPKSDSSGETSECSEDIEPDVEIQKKYGLGDDEMLELYP